MGASDHVLKKGEKEKEREREREREGWTNRQTEGKSKSQEER